MKLLTFPHTLDTLLINQLPALFCMTQRKQWFHVHPVAVIM